MRRWWEEVVTVEVRGEVRGGGARRVRGDGERRQLRGDGERRWHEEAGGRRWHERRQYVSDS